jgi:hypothetical protein
MEALIVVGLLWTWVGSIVCGAIAGQQGGSMWNGFLLGTLFGPIGVLAAMSMKKPRICPKCEKPIPPPLCPACAERYRQDTRRAVPVK